MKKNILLVVPNVPYPLSSGGHYRDWQILNLLARAGHKIHLLYFGAGEDRVLAPGTPVGPLCESVTYGGPRIEAPDRDRTETLKRKLGYLTGLGGTTFPFSYQYDAMDAGRVIVDTAVRLHAEAVVLRSFWCHHIPVLKAEGLRVIANCPDYNTHLAWKMVRSVPTILRKIGPLCNYVGVRRQERNFLPLCDEIWIPTEEESRRLKKTGSSERILVMPNLLDVASYPDYSVEVGDGATMLFIATFSYTPNANAARLLLTEIFPLVKARVSSARLVLVGKGLSPELTRLAEALPDVELAGFVEDLRPYYRRAAIVLLPVREGAGMLVKTLEALCFGKAAIGFPEAFRGLGGEGNRPFVVARMPREFVERTATLLQDHAARAELAYRARAYAERHVSWIRGVEILGNSILSA